MTSIDRQAVVPYRCEQMYELVNDVASYQNFLPWCQSSVVEEVLDDYSIRARLSVHHKGISMQFSTLNRSQPHEHICMQLAQGPFKHLQGDWTFTELGDGAGCQIVFSFEYEFLNRFYQMLLNKVFDRIAQSLMDAFLAEADVRYGAGD